MTNTLSNRPTQQEVHPQHCCFSNSDFTEGHSDGIKFTCVAGQDGTEVAVEAVDEPTSGSAEEGAKAAHGRVRVAPAQPWCGEYALTSARFAAGVVGAKSLNTQALQVRRQARMPCAVAFSASNTGIF